MIDLFWLQTEQIQFGFSYMSRPRLEAEKPIKRVGTLLTLKFTIYEKVHLRHLRPRFSYWI